MRSRSWIISVRMDSTLACFSLNPFALSDDQELTASHGASKGALCSDAFKPVTDHVDRNPLIVLCLVVQWVAVVMQRDESPINIEARRAGRTRLRIRGVANARAVCGKGEHS